MNRQERRRAFALGVKAAQTGELPPDYVRVIGVIVHAYGEYRRKLPDREAPRFALPSKEFMVIATLDDPSLLPRIARNETALSFLTALVEGARADGDPKSMPTLFMLSVALEQVGAKIERVSLAEFGLSMGGQKGRNN
jgi:hypothetical protein